MASKACLPHNFTPLNAARIMAYLSIPITLHTFLHASGNVLKALIARALSRRFHTKSYFERMQV